MNKVQMYEDLGNVLYLLCDYIAEESEQFVDDKKIRHTLEKVFSRISKIQEDLEDDGGMYTPEQFELMVG